MYMVDFLSIHSKQCASNSTLHTTLNEIYISGMGQAPILLSYVIYLIQTPNIFNLFFLSFPVWDVGIFQFGADWISNILPLKRRIP